MVYEILGQEEANLAMEHFSVLSPLNALVPLKVGLRRNVLGKSESLVANEWAAVDGRVFVVVHLLRCVMVAVEHQKAERMVVAVEHQKAECMVVAVEHQKAEHMVVVCYMEVGGEMMDKGGMAVVDEAQWDQGFPELFQAVSLLMLSLCSSAICLLTDQWLLS
jgi:hypothetical protein